jgi:polyhydroxyalkanoate synthesis repressor PhaR
MSDERIIKRYANRKLYDTQHSRYVTLDQISEMIRNGDDVKIIDNKSKEDLTSVTLAQIIFEEEKKQRSFLPLQAMKNIIQTGGESITTLVTQAQKKVTNIIPHKKGKGEGEEGEEEGDADDDGEVEDDAKKGLGNIREFREWLQNTQHSIEEWQKKVDDRIRNVVEGISPFAGVQKDVRLLATRIAELESKLADMIQEESDSESSSDSDDTETDE